MMKVASSIEKQVKAFCTSIGADRLLVQGAGGNVSWKDGDVLWVKASGTWLAEAESKEIFVPVNLPHLLGAIAEQDFSVKPEVKNDSGLRPSIETLLHALMPHRVVVHLHAIEILAHLIQVDAREKIHNLVGPELKWIFVDYFKPGADLAKAVSDQLSIRTDADVDVVFMGSHGVVIGGRDVDEVVSTLDALLFKFKKETTQILFKNSLSKRQSEFLSRGYVPCIDKEVSLLTINEDLIHRLRYQWTLYPDHVVFLGAEAVILEENFRAFELDEISRSKPPFIFALCDGLYESCAATPAEKSQLRCYFDVVTRLDSEVDLSILTKMQVSELLDWDAEKYRQNFINDKQVVA